jgi:hypothetical protein
VCTASATKKVWFVLKTVAPRDLIDYEVTDTRHSALYMNMMTPDVEVDNLYNASH